MAKLSFSEKMEEVQEIASADIIWEEIGKLAKDSLISKGNDLPRILIIRNRLENDMKKGIIKDLADEIINVCQIESLPSLRKR